MEGETDLTEIDFGTDLLTGIDLVDLSKDPSSKNDEENNEAHHQSTGKASSVALGADARAVLDSTEGRNALINDLEELTNFLIRIRENLIEFQAADFDVSETKVKKRTAGLNIDTIAPIYHQIMLVSAHYHINHALPYVFTIRLFKINIDEYFVFVFILVAFVHHCIYLLPMLLIL